MKRLGLVHASDNDDTRCVEGIDTEAIWDGGNRFLYRVNVFEFSCCMVMSDQNVRVRRMFGPCAVHEHSPNIHPSPGEANALFWSGPVFSSIHTIPFTATRLCRELTALGALTLPPASCGPLHLPLHQTIPHCRCTYSRRGGMETGISNAYYRKQTAV